MSATSIADMPQYRDALLKAVADDTMFARFKQTRELNNVWEHVSQEWGGIYLAFIKERFPDLLKPETLKKLKKNDEVGNPRVFEYGEYGLLSPTTLRYIYVLGDLMRLFGDLSGKTIMNIGAGYGGQELIIRQMFPAAFSFVDLPEAEALQCKYLRANGIEVKQHQPGDMVETPDLVISNYAFSECIREVQEGYIEIMKRTPRGYVTGNFVGSNFAFGGLEAIEMANRMRPEEMLAAIPGSKMRKHEPEFCAGLFLWTWGEK